MEPDEMQALIKPAIMKLRSGAALASGEPCKQRPSSFNRRRPWSGCLVAHSPRS